MRVAIVHLGRSGAMGEQRRARSWAAVLAAAGHDPFELKLRQVALVKPTRGQWPSPSTVIRGASVPETLAWSPAVARRLLTEHGADAVVCMTSRCYDPSFGAHGRRVVLDLVDRLSTSYLDRASVAARGPERVGLRTLARAARRFESSASSRIERLVAAGYHEAALLGAKWMPIVAEPVCATTEPADHDLVFVGTLGYAPNIDAIRFLDRVWSDVQRARPGTTALVAGARPTPEVAEIAARHRWTLVADFADSAAIYGRGKVAIAPVQHVAGMQIKVLDAAMLGVAQVVSSHVLRGYAPGFPALVADGAKAFVHAVASVLDDAAERERLLTDARTHATERYSVERWAPVADALLED